MNIRGTDVMLLGHAACGALAGMAALWIFVEALNARAENMRRMRVAAFVAAISMAVTWILGGYWYVHSYPTDRKLILGGPWPFAHNVFMESKEHLVFVTGLLAFYLVIAMREKIYANAAARKMVLSVAMLIVLTSVMAEGAGAIIDHGAKIALLRGNPGGAK